MLHINEFSDFLNENQTTLNISEEDLNKLFNDEDVTLSDIRIKYGINVILYDLVRLAQGAIVDVEEIPCKIKLEDGIKFKNIRNIIRNSPFNEYGALFGLFIDTHPMKMELPR